MDYPTRTDMTAEEMEEWIEEYWPRIRRVIEIHGKEDVLADFYKSDHPVSKKIADRIRKFSLN